MAGKTYVSLVPALLLSSMFLCTFPVRTADETALRIEKAYRIAASLTAYARLPSATPTPTLTFTPSPTLTPTSTSVPATHTPTWTPTATGTPAPDAVVVASTVALYGGPGTNYPPAGSLKKGQELVLLGQYGDCDWLQVSAAGQAPAWVEFDRNRLDVSKNCATLPPGVFRPPTGFITRLSRTGKGELTIENGTDADGLVVLTDAAEKVIVSVYLRAGASYTVKGVPDGIFTVFFTTGSDWDGEKFTTNANYKRFSDTLSFTTSSSTYTIWTVTLHAVAGGNAPAYPVNPGDFPGLGP